MLDPGLPPEQLLASAQDVLSVSEVTVYRNAMNMYVMIMQDFNNIMLKEGKLS